RVSLAVHPARHEGHGRGRRRRDPRDVRSDPGCAAPARRPDRDRLVQPAVPGVRPDRRPVGEPPGTGGRGRMKVEGERDFAVPRTVVWDCLNDPSKMAELMPGVQSFDIKDDRNWVANVKIPLGLGSLAMTIDFEKTEERPPEFSSLHAKG